MNKDSENIKEVWEEPKFYIINFKETRGGTISSASEDLRGTIASMPS